jgi:hypothetical protein
MSADVVARQPSAEALATQLRRFLRRPRLVAAQAGLLLLAGLAVSVGSVWPVHEHVPGPGPTIVIPPPRIPLTAEFEALVFSKEDKSKGTVLKEGIRIGNPGALPIRAGERIHLQARLNQKAYAYMLWIDGEGNVVSLHPWSDRKFGCRSAAEAAHERVDSPEALNEGWRVQGPAGLETVLLLVRRTPLPSDVDLAATIGALPPAPLSDPRKVALLGFDEGAVTRSINVGQNRGIGERPETIDEPLLHLMEKLRKLGLFEVIRAVRFAYGG